MRRFAACLILLAALVPAQDRGKPPADPALLQRTAMEKLSRLSETLAALSQKLKKAEPGKAGILRAALDYLGEKGVEERMRAVLEEMDAERWQDALDRMAGIEKDLSALLELLLDRNKELLDLLERIRKLQDLRKEMDSLLKEQTRERDQAARTAELQDLRRALEEAARKLARLEAAQRTLAKAAAGGSAGAREKTRQESLETAARKLAASLEDLEKKAARLAGRKETAGAAEETKKAARSMGKAGKSLEAGKSSQAAGAMKSAADRLAEARRRLEGEAREAKNRIHRLALAEQARAQAKTAERTERLAGKLKKAREGRERGERAREAVPHQKNASGSLGQGKAGPAVPEQDKALEMLQESRERIEEALQQARRRLQEELLQDLKLRIAGMLAGQRRISAAVRVLHAKAGQAFPPPREVLLEAGKLGRKEGDLAEEARRILLILKEEGSTVVIPGIMDTVRRNLLFLAEDLGKGLTGPRVQGRQGETENLLEAVLEALRKEQDERDQGDSNSSENKDQPLVSRRAELKMVRLLQQAVYEATLRARILSEKDRTAAREEAKRLAPRQKKILDLTRNLAERIRKDLAEEEEGGR